MSSGDSRSILALLALAALAALAPPPAWSQEPEPATRAALIAQAQAQKARALHPFEPGKVERVVNTIEEELITGAVRVHPFFDSAYAGGGFTLGAGYLQHVGAYSFVDLRGSLTFSGYKRIEGAFVAPRLFQRRGTFTFVGGWREATQVGFYGTGTPNTSKDDRADYSFDQPYGTATLEFWPARRILLLRGALELSQWNQGPGHDASVKSVDEVYTPETLPGLGSHPAYVHTAATVGIDTRPSPGYARHGGFYGVTFHDFNDSGNQFGFTRTDYEAIQHIPVLRDAWVLSLHGRVEVASAASDQQIPFFMLPALGGGSSLRGFASWRFRDRNSLLAQAEWRVILNRFLDVAAFYDAGRVAARTADLTDAPLKSDYGVGFRFHGLLATPLRIELARSNEGLSVVFSSKAAF